MLDLPWTTETDMPYGEQPRIYDATGTLIAVVGNAETEKQDDWERNASAIVNAVNALSALTPAEAGGLVERLRGIYRIPITDGLGAVGSGEEPDNPNQFVRKFDTSPIQHEAAGAIEVLSDALASERAAHAQTMQERDELFELVEDCRKREMLTNDRLAEALKALEPFAKVAHEWDSEIATLHVFLEWNDSAEPVPSLPVADFRAARRVREGGKVDG